MQSIRRKGFRISCARPKIGLQSWKRRSALIRNEPSALSNGSIASTPKLRIDFCGRVPIKAARHNSRTVPAGARGFGPSLTRRFELTDDDSGHEILDRL